MSHALSDIVFQGAQSILLVLSALLQVLCTPLLKALERGPLSPAAELHSVLCYYCLFGFNFGLVFFRHAQNVMYHFTVWFNRDIINLVYLRLNLSHKLGRLTQKLK